MQQEINLLMANLGSALMTKGLTVATAESCTGGLLAHHLTSISGSSSYFIGGVVAYSNRIKQEMLGVREETLVQFGAVSEQTAQEMASGIRARFHTDIGLSTTGIAGPTGGTHDKPVGLVWIGISTPENTRAYECHFEGDRTQIKTQTVHQILLLLSEHLK